MKNRDLYLLWKIYLSHRGSLHDLLREELAVAKKKKKQSRSTFKPFQKNVVELKKYQRLINPEEEDGTGKVPDSLTIQHLPLLHQIRTNIQTA